MKGGPKSSLRPFLHRALQLLKNNNLILNVNVNFLMTAPCKGLFSAMLHIHIKL